MRSSRLSDAGARQTVASALHLLLLTAALVPAARIAAQSAVPAEPVDPFGETAMQAPMEPFGEAEPVPTRWRHLGRVIQVDAAERIVLVLADPVPGAVPAEVFSRDGELRPTARMVLLPPRRAGVFAALSRGGLPEVGEEVVYDVTPPEG